MYSFVCGLIVGMAFIWLWYLLRYQSLRQRLQSISNTLHEEAKRSSDALKAEADAHFQHCLDDIAKEKNSLTQKERQLKDKTHSLSLETQQLRKEANKLDSLKKELLLKEQDLAQHLDNAQKKLEETASLTLEEAKSTLIEKAEIETAKTIENRMHALLSAHEKEAHRRAQELLFSAMERKTQSLTKEIFLTQLPFENSLIIPSLIGKDGRNIHTLEELLQVKLIIENDRLLISSHDARQRFIAQKVLDELLKQDKISHPRIMAVYDTVLHNIDAYLQSEAKLALTALNTSHSYNSEILLALGNLSLRSSSGQNLLKHSIEVAEFMGIFAAELQLRPKTAKLMGIFHDIGKILTTTYGESHAAAGKTFLQQHQFDEEIVNAVAAHHGECVATSEEARLLPICDRLSAQLPGIRSPVEPLFLSMVRQCEEAANRHPSVLSAWAHYAGTHIELMVRHRQVESEVTLRHQMEKRLCGIPIPINITFLNVYGHKATILKKN